MRDDRTGRAVASTGRAARGRDRVPRGGAYVSTSVAPADRPLNVVHTQLAHIGPRLVWVVDLELPQRTDCHRPGVYSYCVPSFLPPGHLLVTVDDATGRVRHVSRP